MGWPPYLLGTWVPQTPVQRLFTFLPPTARYCSFMVGSTHTESALLSFYRGHGTDHAGRRLDDILTWDHRRLEMVHDYIQWLFPLPDPSRFNTQAPLLTPKDIASLRASPELQAKVRAVLDVMLNFFGLVRQGGSIARTAKPLLTELHWLQPLNHNHLRLTRILLFLRHAGLNDDAAALLRCLEDIAAHEGRDAVGARTLTFWRDALR